VAGEAASDEVAEVEGGGAGLQTLTAIRPGRAPWRITPEEVERRVHQMLTASPALLDELTALLARGLSGAAERQPPLPAAVPEAGRSAARRRSSSG
jgi:hypothetical protein